MTADLRRATRQLSKSPGFTLVASALPASRLPARRALPVSSTGAIRSE